MERGRWFTLAMYPVINVTSVHLRTTDLHFILNISNISMNEETFSYKIGLRRGNMFKKRVIVFQSLPSILVWAFIAQYHIPDGL